MPESEVVPPRGGGSRAWGVATGIIGPLLLGGLVPLVGWMLSSSGPTQADETVAGVLLSLVGAVPGLLLVAAVVLAALPRTRRFGLGVLLGLGILLVVAAGTCVALFAGLNATGG